MSNVDSQDRVDLAYSVREGTGYPILFIHGFSHNRHVWDCITAELNPGLRPYRIDLRGHGDSGWSAQGHYAPQDYARDLPRVVDELGLERLLLVGHSLGGLTAALFADRFPEAVEGLVLVDTGPDLSVPAMNRIAQDTENAIHDFDSTEAYEEWLSSVLPMANKKALSDFADRSLVQRLDGRFEVKLDPGTLAPDRTENAWAEFTAEIEMTFRRIQCPTLLVRGGRSALLSRSRAEHLAHEQLQRGRLITLENAGHAVMLEDGPSLRGVIESFASEVLGTPLHGETDRKKPVVAQETEKVSS